MRSSHEVQAKQRELPESAPAEISVSLPRMSDDTELAEKTEAGAPPANAGPRVQGFALFAPAPNDLKNQAAAVSRTITYSAAPEGELLKERTRNSAVELRALSSPSGTTASARRQSRGAEPAEPSEKSGDTLNERGVAAEKPIVMEGFEVQEQEDKGSYRANSTLAGTRVRPDSNDVAASIGVVTQQFLHDTGTTNAQNPLTNESAGGGQNSTEDANAAAPAAEAAQQAQTSPTTVTTSPAVSEGVEQTVLSPFVVDASEDKKSLQGKTQGGLDAFQVAGKDERAGLSAPAGSIVFPDAGPRSVLFGVGSPAGLPQKTETPGTGSLRDEVQAAKSPVSTFSLHVSDASFLLVKAALESQGALDPAQVRPEEFYNAFDYGDPSPAISEKVSCRIEQAADPFRQQRNLVRIAMKVPATGREAAQPLRLTVLLDTSGSMEREDRAAAVRKAFEILVSLLGPNDRLTLVGFARRPRMLAEQVHGDQAGPLLEMIRRIPAEGGTNLEEALKLGSELAVRQFQQGAQNRIVLLTDGATNLGNADPARLASSVESIRQQDIAFDACGVGAGGIDDAVLEALTRKGGGRYYILDSPEAADAGFARQIAGALHPAAQNVKVQVRFNPARVGSYRLIGFENHRLQEQDFRNDQVAAAALAGGEAAVAMYEVQPLPQGEGELGEVYVRFRDTATGAQVERSWTMAYDPSAPALDRASPSMQLAGAAALVAEKLQGGAAFGLIKLSQLAPEMATARAAYAHEKRVQEFWAMVEQMRRISPE